jgi:hypothetical protein
VGSYKRPAGKDCHLGSLSLLNFVPSASGNINLPFRLSWGSGGVGHCEGMGTPSHQLLGVSCWGSLCPVLWEHPPGQATSHSLPSLADLSVSLCTLGSSSCPCFMQLLASFQTESVWRAEMPSTCIRFVRDVVVTVTMMDIIVCCLTFETCQVLTICVFLK